MFICVQCVLNFLGLWKMSSILWKMSSILRHRASAPPPPYQVLSNEGDGPNPTQFRVHVSVNSEVFLVGVPNPRAKVSWPAKNVAERYFRETGLKVSLRIRERSGAKLSDDDIIGVVVGNGDQLGTDVTIIKEEEQGCACTIM